MNPGTMVAIHAAATAAAAAKARTRVLDAFRTHDATAPTRARTLAEIGLGDRDRAVGDLIQAGVLRGVDSRGRLTVLGDIVDRVVGYYLDEAAFIAHRDQKDGATNRKAVAAIVLGMVVAALVALGVVMAVGR